MMKKLIIFFCGTLALTACGNGIEKKANEKLTVARAAYERGDYEEAKTQIDSIKILYPKAFEARKAGQALMLDVETKAQQKTLAYLDSALRAKTEEFNAIKDKFILIWTVPFSLNKKRSTPSKTSTRWKKMPNINKWATISGLLKPSKRTYTAPSSAFK